MLSCLHFWVLQGTAGADLSNWQFPFLAEEARKIYVMCERALLLWPISKAVLYNKRNPSKYKLITKKSINWAEKWYYSNKNCTFCCNNTWGFARLLMYSRATTEKCYKNIWLKKKLEKVTNYATLFVMLNILLANIMWFFFTTLLRQSSSVSCMVPFIISPCQIISKAQSASNIQPYRYDAKKFLNGFFH